jgi:acetylornithine aminotransferase
MGLMIGIELDRPCGEVTRRALEAGLVVNVTAESVVRLLPPLVITREQAEQLVSILAPVVKQFLAESKTAAAA